MNLKSTAFASDSVLKSLYVIELDSFAATSKQSNASFLADCVIQFGKISESRISFVWELHSFGAAI